MRRLFVEYDNEPMSALTHLLGVLLSIAGLVLLVVFASKKGTAWHVVSFSIFGATLVLLYAASTLYHFAPIGSKAKKIFGRLDHSMIYALIAGTYTPVCFITLKGAWGWSIFGVVWGFAILGIVLKSCGVNMNKTLSTIYYVLLGWIGVIAFIPLKENLPSTGLLLLFLGGVAYSIGAVAFSYSHIKFHKKWFGMHEVFHIFVLIGSLCHFFMVFNYLI